jgi:hypothetical protein
MSDKVYIFDEIEAAQPVAVRLREAYLARYVPIVADVAAWWAMRLGAARADPENDVPLDGHEEKTNWWAWVDAIAITRKRTFLRDIAEVADV